ncbi:MAG: hypothetical protein U0165_12215 [Polyangiaceae bacterium]
MSTFSGLSLGLVFGTWQARSEQLEPADGPRAFGVAFNIGPPKPTSDMVDDDIDDYFNSRGWSFAVGISAHNQCSPSADPPPWPTFSNRHTPTVHRNGPVEGRIVWSKRVGM